MEQGHTEGTFHYRKIPNLCLFGASPKPQKTRAKANGALASLVSFQKQKLIVVKIFMKLDIEKRFFRGAISELLCHS